MKQTDKFGRRILAHRLRRSARDAALSLELSGVDVPEHIAKEISLGVRTLERAADKLENSTSARKHRAKIDDTA